MEIDMKTLLLIIFIVIIYATFLSKKSFIKYKLFSDRSEKLYYKKLAMGKSKYQALKDISMARHPELSEDVHEALAKKFDDINALINFIWKGLEGHLLNKKEFTDENALKLINAARVVQKGYYDYRVIIDSTENNNDNNA